MKTRVFDNAHQGSLWHYNIQAQELRMYSRHSGRDYNIRWETSTAFWIQVLKNQHRLFELPKDIIEAVEEWGKENGGRSLEQCVRTLVFAGNIEDIRKGITEELADFIQGPIKELRRVIKSFANYRHSEQRLTGLGDFIQEMTNPTVANKIKWEKHTGAITEESKEILDKRAYEISKNFGGLEISWFSFDGMRRELEDSPFNNLRGEDIHNAVREAGFRWMMSAEEFADWFTSLTYSESTFRANLSEENIWACNAFIFYYIQDRGRDSWINAKSSNKYGDIYESMLDNYEDYFRRYGEPLLGQYDPEFWDLDTKFSKH